MRDQLVTFIQRRGDETLATGLTAGALVQIWLLDESAGARLAASAGAVALGIAAARRVRMPLVLLGLLLIGSAAGAALPKRLGDIEAIGLFILLAVYSAAAHTSGRRTLLAGALTFVLYITAMATDPEGINIAAVIFFALVFGGPWVAGRAIRHRRLKSGGSSTRRPKQRRRSSRSARGSRASSTTSLRTQSASWFSRRAAVGACSRPNRATRGRRSPSSNERATKRSRKCAACSACSGQAMRSSRSRRSPACSSSTGWSSRSGRPDYRSKLPSRVKRETCRRASTSPPTGSCRRR